MNIAKQYHTGTRKDGVTHEFHHQLEIVWFLINLGLDDSHAEHCVSVAFLHDLLEDYDITSQDLTNERIPSIIIEDVKRVSKQYDGGEKIANPEYFERVRQQRATVFVKCADRIQNLSSMVGVFTDSGQQKYVDEVNTYFIPILDERIEIDPHFRAIYLNLRTILHMIQHTTQDKLDGKKSRTD
jgi:(p)ppGpp synthase/HD superfamily hydrolase